MHLPIPLQVLYAGLAGCLLALAVATATNGWSLRVFALLALRLAIGWHFLFEGLHKVHSTYVGPTETNRPFSSEMYFVAAEGPVGDMMRKQWIGDPVAAYTARLIPPKSMAADEFAKLSEAEQANLCPASAAAEIAAGATDAALTQTSKAMFAKWVYGDGTRDAKVKFVTGDVALTAPQRLAHIDRVRAEYNALLAQREAGLGTGYGIDQKNATGVKADLTAAQNDLAKDTQAYLGELNKLAGGTGEVAAPEKKIALLDRMTRWGITAIGAGLLLGLFTRVWCLAGAGFLVMTYLSHPTVPWLPLPPMTEGNPLFINKNLIEALALIALATFPTGRWLGLDALVACAFGCKKPARV